VKIMTRILLRAALLGALAMAGLAAGGTSAMAQCAVPGSTDCPLTPNPYGGGHPEMYEQRLPHGTVNPGWNNPGVVNPPVVNAWEGRRHHQRWRNGWNDGPRVYVDRYVPVYPPSYYYDDYDDGYYDRPRYRVAPRRAARIYMSEEHVEWCYDHYRTYRESDNTYKKTRRTRAQCISPFS
jgi:hypothetical protein